MNYENYVLSLKKNIMEINKAVKDGAILTRLEEFDYMFKKELAIAEGVRAKRSIVNRILNNISDVDYRTANFYAEGFSSIIKTANEGYTVKGISKQFKGFIKIANSKFICSARACAIVSDLNGKIIVKMGTEHTKAELFEISNTDDYIKTAIHLLSLLGSLEEDNDNYKTWFNEYLYNIWFSVANGCKAEPFVERKSVALDLKSYMIGTYKERSIASGDGKVVHLVK